MKRIDKKLQEIKSKYEEKQTNLKNQTTETTKQIEVMDKRKKEL